MLEYSVNSDKNQDIFYFQGDLTIHHTDTLKDIAQTCLDAKNDAVFELSNINDIDTSGLQLLIATNAHFTKHQRKLNLTGLNEQVFEYMSVLGLLDQLNINSPLSN